MRKADLEKYRESLLALVDNPEALIAAAMEEHEARIDAENKLIEVQNGQDDLFKEHQRVKKERDSLRVENKKLQKAVVDLTAQLDARKRDCYGRKTESSDALANAASEENDDPISEDAPADQHPVPRNFDAAVGELTGGGRPDTDDDKPGGKKQTGGKKDSKNNDNPKDRWAGIPCHTEFDYDLDYLNSMFGGETEWFVIGFHMSETVEHIREVHYRERVYRPVVKLRNGRIIAPEMVKFYPHSFLSESLLASIYDKVFNLSVPVYRLMKNTDLGKLPITDTTVYNWLIHFSLEYLKPIHEYLVFLMMGIAYHQCDETTWMVIRDGRKAGAKGYMWVHVTSELYDGPKIVVIEFELTRGTDHLRKFYRLFKGNIGSDAFAAYPLLEKENPGMITISGCMMHVRRRFFFAFLIVCKAAISEDDAVSSLEAQALVLIGEIYMADTPLKELPTQERLERRQTEVRPLVDKFYDFVRKQNLTDPALSDKMRDALSYALNHENEIRRFLDDGNIAIDNGYCERAIKPIALARRNSLFSTSLEGAEATAISMSLTYTAKANGAIPYFYYKYLFEEIPKHLSDPGMEWRADCMAWSEKYKAYEASERMKLPNITFDDFPEDPWIIWKQLQNQDKCA